MTEASEDPEDADMAYLGSTVITILPDYLSR